MASVKSLNTDFTITNKISPLANITLATHTVFVQGNLVVGGNSTSVSKTDMDITDNIIELNKGETGAGVTLVTSGIKIDRGSLPSTYIYYRESDNKWIATEDGSTIKYLLTSTSGGNVAIFDDKSPKLGGNLDVFGQNIFSSNTAYVPFDDNIALQTTSVVPTAKVGYTVLYAQNITTPGGSGLFVVNNGSDQEELITKKQSVGYSIIFS